MKEFASARLYTKLTEWRATFDWEDRSAGILSVTLTVSNNGCSLYDDGYLLTHEQLSRMAVYRPGNGPPDAL